MIIKPNLLLPTQNNIDPVFLTTDIKREKTVVILYTIFYICKVSIF